MSRPESLTKHLSCISGNIRVFCRCRPLNIAERAVGLSSVVEFVKGSVEDDELTVQTGTSCKKVFKFDRVFCPDDSQGMSTIALYHAPDLTFM